MYKLVNDLKENNEDFEFYPTSKKMIEAIFNSMVEGSKVLDIGCGTCNFKKYYNEIAEERYKSKCAVAKYHDSVSKVKLESYFVIEKSKILLSKLDKDTMVLGTDFNSTLLIDKPVDTIFCNPPYSEFKQWMCKIIKESNCFDIYFIVPERWKLDGDIKKCVEDYTEGYKILDKTDFLNAERKARAKVHILHITKKHRKNSRFYKVKLDEYNESAFDSWFDETFSMRDKEHEPEEEPIGIKINNKLATTNDSKAKILVDLYNEEISRLFKNFKAITAVDEDILETVGVSKLSIKNYIKEKIKNLKHYYWEQVFDEMEEITERLTHGTRVKMLERFKELKTVDFTVENIYPLILWVIKNANNYYDDQLIDFYKSLSSDENVKPYKSNKKVFKKGCWRFSSIEETHYTLDYRIICDRGLLDYKTSSWSEELQTGYDHTNTIKDIKAIFKNLGFSIRNIDEAEEFGKTYYAKGYDDETMFDYKVFKNGNLHIRFNIEFTKALNVEASRLLGWIRCKEDIEKEFEPNMAKGAEKYFKQNKYLSLTNNVKLLSCSN